MITTNRIDRHLKVLEKLLTKLIEANTTIPTKKSQVFSTAADNQPAVDIRIAQGERPMYPDNKEIGRFQLADIPPAPRGVPQIEVTFDIDANGIVSVGAKDKGTGKEQKITIKADGGLSDEDIEKMVKEAEANKESDKKKRELVEAKNQSETLTHQIDKQLKEHGDKISEEEKKAIEDAKTTLIEATKSDDVSKIQEGIKTLTEASMKLGEAVYKQAQQEQAQEQAQPEQKEGADENVVDADFKEVDPKEEEDKK